jgi:hypothetical protein
MWHSLFPKTLLMSLHRDRDDDVSYCKERDNVIGRRLMESSRRITRRMGCVLLRGHRGRGQFDIDRTIVLISRAVDGELQQNSTLTSHRE